nr:hypothetical protein [Tanacetum cinerariifolium]
MYLVDYIMKDLQDIDLCLVMASQLRCETSVEDLKHSLPWFYMVLGEECTYFLNKSLIAKNLKKWLDVIKISQVIIEYLAKDGEKDKHTPYLKTLKNSRPLPDFEEYAIDTPYTLWSKIKKNTFSANTPYLKTPILRIGQYPYPRNRIWRIGQYAVSKNQIWRIQFLRKNFGIFYSWSPCQATPIRRIEFQYAVSTDF